MNPLIPGKEQEATSGPDKPFLRAFDSRLSPAVPPPVWLMRQAGRYLPEYRRLRARAGDFQEFCRRPELALEATLQPIRRFGFDAAIVFSDILLLPAALGQELRFEEGRGPRLSPALGCAADLSRLDAGGFLSRLAPTLETLSLARARLPAQTGLIGFAGAPWTVATYMTRGEDAVQQGEAKLFFYRDADGFAALLDLLAETTAAWLEAQVEAGAEAVQLFESWAGDLPEELFERCSLAPVARIAGRLRARFPRLPVLLFSKGCGLLQRRYVTDAGVSGLGIDSATPCSWARREIQPRALVQGNLDPWLLLCGGAPMERQVGRILDELAGGPFVFNLGHGVLPATPPAHVARLVELVRGHRRPCPCPP